MRPPADSTPADSTPADSTAADPTAAVPDVPAVHDDRRPLEIDELGRLSSIKADGERRRQKRHRRNAGLGIAAAALVAVPGVLLIASRDDSPTRLEVAAEVNEETTTTRRQATSSTRAPATTATPTTVAAPVAADPAVAPTLPEPPPAAQPRPQPEPTVPAKPCRNSVEPRCGGFSWDPAPRPNQPATITVTVNNPTPMVGEEVVFTVSYHDADGLAGSVDSTVDDGVLVGDACHQEPRYGPWEPPGTSGASGTAEYRRTYDTPGRSVETFLVTTGNGECDFPYASSATTSVEVIAFDPAPPPSTEPP